MSFQIPLKTLDKSRRDEIIKTLVYEQPIGVQQQNGEYLTKKIYAYELSIERGTITLPMHFARNILGCTLPNIDFQTVKFPSFQGQLYPDQISTRNECIQFLNQEKSCILSLPVGCGKCLHPDTLVIMFNGALKQASQLQVNDILMGDDNKPRIVLSTTIGQDKMYTVYNNDYHVEYTVNSHHILTVWNTLTEEFEDISIQKFLSTSNAQLIYRGCRISIQHFGNTHTLKYRYERFNSYFKTETFSTVDKEEYDNVLLLVHSLGFWVTFTGIKNDKYVITINRKRREDKWLYPIFIKFASVGQYAGFELSGNGRFLLHDCSITHNTAIALNIATKIKLKTIVIVNRLLLLNQWKENILKFCSDASIYILDPKKKDVPQCHDFYLVNAINVPKFSRQCLSFIGYCIVDECHMIMSEILSRCLWNICPKYLIGLSATPYRTDGLNDMIAAYFGPKQVTRNIPRKHIVYKVNTGFDIAYTFNRFGKMDWNSLLNTQSLHPERNNLIINIVKNFPERYFLLLTKRIEQAQVLSKLLEEQNIEYDCLCGQTRYIETTKRVLIGTTGKCGVGFDAPKLNTLILCSDMVNYYIQMLGRVMRRRDSDAWVFDLVDENSILKKHYYERCKTYKEHGGIFKNYTP